MWFLTCDGDHLSNKRVWLRPGSIHLFGRTHQKPDNGRFHAITHKSVSRQHFELSVEVVEPGASAHLHNKSKVTLKDLGSKIGTFVDGERIQNTTKLLDKNEHTLKLGNYDTLFYVKWQPKVFSFTSLSRNAKQAEDPLADKRSRLEALDIKCITEYVTQYTTHVVSRKRNTASVLQALVNGRHIVTDDFVNAVERAGQKQGHEQVSALEEDLDANWPSELDCLPPPSNEPNPRPAHDGIFSPKTERSEMFEKFIFVFCTVAQYDTLLPVVTGGGGKALLKEVSAPEDNPNAADLIDYVRESLGKKGDRGYRLSQQPRKGGVVVVRPGDTTTCGGSKYFQAVDSALDQRSVQQNEFLEAILTVDATLLKRPLEDVPDSIDDTARPAESSTAQQPAQSPVRETARSAPAVQTQQNSYPTPAEEPASSALPTTAVKRKPRRPLGQSRFKGFDDFDPSQVNNYSPPPQSQDVSQGPSQLQSFHDIEADAQSQAPVGSPSKPTRKRPAESQLPAQETTADAMNDVTKNTTAFKKRRLEEEAQQSQRKGFATKRAVPDSDDEAEDATASTSKRPAKRKKEKEIDVTAVLLARREAEDKRRQEDEEYLRNAIEGMDITQLRNLAQVEDMEVRAPRRTSRSNEPEQSHPEWNGRPNFKKFRKRRPGQAGIDDDAAGPARRKVIVEMEPYQPRSYSGEEYWLENSASRSSGKGRTSQGSSSKDNSGRVRDSTGAATGDEDSTVGPARSALARRIKRSRIDDEENEVDTALHPEDIAGTPRDESLRAEVRSQSRTQTQSQSQTLRANASASANTDVGQGRKRSAVDPAAGDAGATRKRQAPAATQGRIATTPRRDVDEDSDDEGGVKFRRRRG